MFRVIHNKVTVDLVGYSAKNEEVTTVNTKQNKRKAFKYVKNTKGKFRTTTSHHFYNAAGGV